MLRDHPKGGSRFLPGISAFSSAVVAMPSHEIVHVTLAAPPPCTLVVAGAGEMGDRARGPEGIVRHGETSSDAMREKAIFVMDIMQARMSGLGADRRG